MHKLMTAILPDADAAQHTLEELHHIGIPDKCISVIARDNAQPENASDSSRLVADPKASINADYTWSMNFLVNSMSNVGLINGEDIGLIGTGPLVAVVSTDHESSDKQKVLDGLHRLHIPDEQIQSIKHAISEGGVLIGVHVSADNEKVVHDVMTQHNAQALHCE